MGDVEAQRYTRLMEREIAVERINAMFGLGVEVRYKQVIPTLPDNLEDGEEGEIDEKEVDE